VDYIMSVYYTSVNDVQEQLMKETPSSVPDATTDEYVNFKNYLFNQLIPNISAYVDNYTHRFFVPLYENRSFYNRNILDDEALDTYGYWWDWFNYRLFLDLDLLEIITFTSTGTALSSAESRGVGTPFYAVDLDWDSNDIDFDTGAFNNSQDILGWWGYHTDWSNAFKTVENITLADDTTTSITVASNANDNYKFPQYVRCEDELMLVTAIADATTLTVERGVRGTTAAAHTTKPLQTFIIENSLHIAVTRMVSWLYMNRVAQGNVVQISDSAVVLDLMPTVVKDNLDRLRKGHGT
jgi:hypothetical protein